MKSSGLLLLWHMLAVIQYSGTADASAAAMAGPRPTAMNERGIDLGFSPKPTARALAADSLSNLFAKRQAENAICGSYGTQTFSCQAGYMCATNDGGDGAGCCPSTALNACPLPTSCINSAAVISACGESCLNNEYIIKCTEAAAPYCIGKVWNYAPSPATELGCANVSTIVTLSPNSAFPGSGSATASFAAVQNTASASAGASGNGGADNNGGGNQIDGNTLVDGGSILVTNSGSGNDTGNGNNDGNGGSASGGGSANGANANGGSNASSGNGNGGNNNGGSGGGGTGKSEASSLSVDVARAVKLMLVLNLGMFMLQRWGIN